MYFEYIIIEITKEQEWILRKLHEETILNKLDYSKKFLRNMLCIRRIALRIGLIKLRIIVKTLALKLHIGH